jgi:hypothetical protein
MMAKILGRTVKAGQRAMERDMLLFSELHLFIGQGALEGWRLFKVKLAATDRNSVPVWIKGDDPLVTLRRAGIAELAGVTFVM